MRCQRVRKGSSHLEPADCSCHRARQLACTCLGQAHGCTSALPDLATSRQIQQTAASCAICGKE